MGSGESSTMKNFVFCTFHLMKSEWAGNLTRMKEGRSALDMVKDETTEKRHLGRFKLI
jgi:hypothetical protein